MIKRCAWGKLRALRISGGWNALVFQVELDFDAMADRLQRQVSERLPVTLAVALTRTARDVAEAERAEMAQDFDRPTPWVLNAFRVVPATAQSLTAEVRQKDDNARRETLRREEAGGARGQKGFEKRLAMALPTHAGARWVPGDNARLDQYGNWSAGQRNQVMSALAVQRDVTSNETTASRKRNARRMRYFMADGTKGMPAGVYGRKPGGHRNALEVILIPVSDAAYSPLFDFTGRAEATVRERLPAHFRAELSRTLTRVLG